MEALSLAGSKQNTLEQIDRLEKMYWFARANEEEFNKFKLP